MGLVIRLRLQRLKKVILINNVVHEIYITNLTLSQINIRLQTHYYI